MADAAHHEHEGHGEHENRPRLGRRAHWRHTRRLTAVLLGIWLLTGFLSIFFARELSALSVFGWPLSFYMAAQGSSLVYLALIAYYAWAMRRLDRAAATAQDPA
jgi:putative solute:sodium symporter small subunit